MTNGKKYTQTIFDTIKDPRKGPTTYGYLGLLYEIIENLKEIRIHANFSQRDLAERSGIAQSHIARLEAGRTNPTLMQIIKIAHILGHKVTFTKARFPDGDYEAYKE